MSLFDHCDTYFISDLFTLKKGKRLTKAQMTLGTTPYLGAIDKNNGVSNYIGQAPLFDGGVITINYDGSIGECFYQPNPFWASDAVNVLIPKFEMPVEVALFITTLLKAEKYRFNYGRKWHIQRLESTRLRLPSKNGIPNWNSITAYMNGLSVNPRMFDGAQASANSSITPNLNIASWKPYSYDTLFNIKKGKRLTKSQMTVGKTPFIGAIEYNNGVSSLISNSPIHEHNTITVSYNGSVGEAFYQSEDYWATDDVNVLYPKFTNTSAISLFICTLIRKEKYRFNYGRKWTMDKMKKSVILLPSRNDGTPDFDLMENYIKSLAYSSKI